MQLLTNPISTIVTSAVNGVLGIDFNPNSIDWAIVDRHGNLKRHGSIKINIQDKSTNQTEDILGKAIAEIVRIAQKYGVPIAIEDLDFTQKKAALKERSTKYARMLSNFAYSKFTQMIETRCIRQGVQLFKVDAAYTSIIGVTKYMALYGLNSGCAAALVIARRAQGRTEKLPLSVARYFKRPEDRLKSGAWAKVSKKIKTCGGKARNEFYHLGDKKVIPNRDVHGKLRSQCPFGVRQSPRSGDPDAALTHRAGVPPVEATGVQKQGRKRSWNTVQVLRTPHIKTKTSAGGSPAYLAVNG